MQKTLSPAQIAFRQRLERQTQLGKLKKESVRLKRNARRRELRDELDTLDDRGYYRKQHGIDLELPPMTVNQYTAPNRKALTETAVVA